MNAATKKKESSLLSYRKSPTKEGAVPPPMEEAATPAKKGRGKGAVVTVSVRLSRADWENLHMLAVKEGTSIQELTIRGYNKLLNEKGLDEMGH